VLSLVPILKPNLNQRRINTDLAQNFLDAMCGVVATDVISLIKHAIPVKPKISDIFLKIFINL
jgi:hypothetical protein